MQITPFNLEKWYVKYEFSSKYNFSASGVESYYLKDLQLTEFLANTKLGYSEAQGNLALREKIAEVNNTKAEQVLVTNGAIEAIFLAQLALIDKNDVVISVKPTYPALYQIAEDLGAKIVDWDLTFETGFQPNIKELSLLCEKYKPKMIILNFPNNPTGMTLNHNEIREICEIAKKYDAFILSDEVYKELNFETNFNYLSPFDCYDKAIVINSMSKAFGIAGARIGWLIASQEVIKKCTNLRHYVSLCNNILGEKIALEILNKKEILLPEILSKIEKNRAFSISYLEKLKENFNIDYLIPKAGLIIFLRLNDIDDTEQFCIDFERETSVLLLPCNKYGSKYANFVRLGYGINFELLEHCFKEFELFLSKYFGK